MKGCVDMHIAEMIGTHPYVFGNDLYLPRQESPMAASYSIQSTHRPRAMRSHFST